jgi:hypothetical protein
VLKDFQCRGSAIGRQLHFGQKNFDIIEMHGATTKII